MIIKTLFVCSNNFARSPIAEAVFNRAAGEIGLQDRLLADSAGAFPGETPRAPDRRAQEICVRNAMDISRKLSREVTLADVNSAQYLFALDEDSFWFVRSLAPGYPQARIKLFLELSGQSGIRDVPDPVLGHSSFEETFELIVQTTPKIITFIRHNEGI